MTTPQDEQLLNSFFQAARQQEIADDGFSDRVMQRLPATQQLHPVNSRRALRLSRIWTCGCWLLALGLFFAFNGWSSLVAALKLFVQTAPSQINFTALLTCMALVPVLLIGEVLRHERNMHRH